MKLSYIHWVNAGVILIFMLSFHFVNALSLQHNPFQYASEYTDFESHLQYLDHRYYQAGILRFISRDSYQLLNRYAYAGGNPIMYDDPSGHTGVLASLTNYALPAVGGVGAMGSMYYAAASATLNMINVTTFLTAATGLTASALLIAQKNQSAFIAGVAQSFGVAAVSAFKAYQASSILASIYVLTFFLALASGITGADALKNPSQGLKYSYNFLVFTTMAMEGLTEPFYQQGQKSLLAKNDLTSFEEPNLPSAPATGCQVAIKTANQEEQIAVDIDPSPPKTEMSPLNKTVTRQANFENVPTNGVYQDKNLPVSRRRPETKKPASALRPKNNNSVIERNTKSKPRVLFSDLENHNQISNQ